MLVFTSLGHIEDTNGWHVGIQLLREKTSVLMQKMRISLDETFKFINWACLNPITLDSVKVSRVPFIKALYRLLPT